MELLVEYGWALWRIRRLARRLQRQRKFDVVHVCNAPDILYLAVLSLRRRGARIVFDHHDLVPELFEARFGARGDLLLPARRLRREPCLSNRRDVVLSPNESDRTVALDRGGKAGRGVFVVRMAPDPSRFRAGEPDPALKRGKPYLLGYAGMIGPQDGVDHALRAMGLLAERRNDWYAIFAGSGDAADDARLLTSELSLDDRVEFVGFVDDDRLIAILGTADVGLAPEPKNALNDASTMIKVVEYMGLGRPIVAFAFGRPGSRPARPRSMRRRTTRRTSPRASSSCSTIPRCEGAWGRRPSPGDERTVLGALRGIAGSRLRSCLGEAAQVGPPAGEVPALLKPESIALKRSDALSELGGPCMKRSSTITGQDDRGCRTYLQSSAPPPAVRGKRPPPDVAGNARNRNLGQCVH